MAVSLGIAGGSPRAARARMAAAIPRLAFDRRSAMRPLRRALIDAARGRARPDERPWIDRIEARRRELLADHARTGLPTVSHGGETPPRFEVGDPAATVGEASALMSLAPEWCLLLLRLVRELRPRSCLELGTGFGISTAYIAAALELEGAGELETLEGTPGWAERARDGLDGLGLGRADVRVGPIAETLPGAAADRAPLEFVFIDAEHQRQATLDHFASIVPHCGELAVVVLDDVDWPPVRSAYEEMRTHPAVSSAIAVGRLGFCAVSR